MITFRSTLRSACFVAVLTILQTLALGAREAQARSAGVGSAFFLSRATPSCNNCHNGGLTPTVDLTASETTLTSDQQITLTFAVTRDPLGTQIAAGFNLRSSQQGTFALAAGSTNTQIIASTAAGSQFQTTSGWSEATHSSPLVATTAVFTVLWTPNPAATGIVTFTAWGNSVNLTGNTSGDRAGTATLDVTVTPACTPVAWYQDLDGDTFGNPNASIPSCTQPGGYVADHTDCDDSLVGGNAIHPGATEICNGVDDNCSNVADEGLPLLTFYLDADADTYGNEPKMACSLAQAGAGYVDRAGDCDDAVTAIHPTATEICNGVDDNCSGDADEGLALAPFYRDFDGDTYGDPNVTKMACSLVQAGAGYVDRAGDCNDALPAIHANALETCNGVDDNCSNVADEGLPLLTFYLDADGDTYGSASKTACSLAQAGAGYVDRAGDCDDQKAAVHPGATEVCNGVDEDCDNTPDDGLAMTTFYLDADHDGYGDPNLSKQACSDVVAGAGYVANHTDCNDANPDISPGSPEICDNQTDDNCSGVVDIDAPASSTFYKDNDHDGFGSAQSGTTTACAPPSGYVSTNTDCNDAFAAIHPGAAEVCNAVDDNCDGHADEGLGTVTCGADPCRTIIDACTGGVPQTCPADAGVCPQDAGPSVEGGPSTDGSPADAPLLSDSNLADVASTSEDAAPPDGGALADRGGVADATQLDTASGDDRSDFGPDATVQADAPGTSFDDGSNGSAMDARFDTEHDAASPSDVGTRDAGRPAESGPPTDAAMAKHDGGDEASSPADDTGCSCRTGRGKDASGKAVFGLTVAFALAVRRRRRPGLP